MRESQGFPLNPDFRSLAVRLSLKNESTSPILKYHLSTQSVKSRFCSNDDDANAPSRPLIEHACTLGYAAHSPIGFTEQQQAQNICQSQSAHETFFCALLQKLAIYDAAVSLNRMQIHRNDDLVSDQTSTNAPCWTNSVSQSDEPS